MVLVVVDGLHGLPNFALVSDIAPFSIIYLTGGDGKFLNIRVHPPKKAALSFVVV